MSRPDQTAILDSERKFAVWTYTVSHAMLLLRSVKTDATPTRVDVLFVGVKRLDIPTGMNGLRVTGDGTYQLSGRDWSGRVTALNCAVKVDDGEYFDPSPFHEGSGI